MKLMKNYIVVIVELISDSMIIFNAIICLYLCMINLYLLNLNPLGSYLTLDNP